MNTTAFHFQVTTRDPRFKLSRRLSFDRTGRRLLIASVAATALGLAAPAGAVHQWFESAKNWTGGEAFTGSDPWSQTFFADVNGDRKTDALAVKNDGIWVRYSDGCRFRSTKRLTSGPFVGTEQTAFGDVTGDKKADAIAVDRWEIRVRRSEDGAVVKTPTVGYANLSVRHYFEDVGGTTPALGPDGKADLIAHGPSNTSVRRSLGGGKFGPNEEWISGQFGGQLSTHFADVTGDKRADAIAVNYSGVMVRQADASRFYYSEVNWTPDGPVYGDRWEFFVDVTGDSKADLVVDN